MNLPDNLPDSIHEEDDSTRSQPVDGTYRVRLHISYDGTAYEGWQRQPAPIRTVQGEVEKALSKLLNQNITITGASRTDSGVHALHQVAHFDCPRDPTQFKDLPYSLQGLLPQDIVVQAAYQAPENFDASWDAESKIYRYYLWNQARPSPIQRKFSLWVRRDLDLELLNKYSSIIEGFHDFASFRNAGGSVKTSERNVLKAQWSSKGKKVIFFVHGQGFLKQMVRNLVGTMLDLEKEKRSPDDFRAILEARDRKKALSTAAAQGLFLTRIFYPRDLDKKCRKL